MATVPVAREAARKRLRKHHANDHFEQKHNAISDLPDNGTAAWRAMFGSRAILWRPTPCLGSD